MIGHLRREWRFYLKYVPCKVALVLDNLSVEVLRSDYSDNDFDEFEAKLLYSLSKPVALPSAQDNNNNEQTSMTINYNASMDTLESSVMAKSNSFTSNFKQYSFSSQDEFGSNLKPDESGSYAKGENKYTVSPPIIHKQQRRPSRQRSIDVPVLCISCGMKTELDSKKYSYSEIQLATNDFHLIIYWVKVGMVMYIKVGLRMGSLLLQKCIRKQVHKVFRNFIPKYMS